MPVYILSYHLGEDHSAASRRYALLRALHGVQRRFWDRTDHAVVFETAHTLTYLGELFQAEIDPKHDLFLLCQLDGGGALVGGANTDPEITALLPGCRTLEP
jgi:hypothetical protein